MLRFAPSPTGDMLIGDLRVALLNFILAKQRDEQFIVRIEDRDKEQNIEGKDEEILLILEKFALPHDQRLNQSENLHIHQTLAIRLLEEQKAFICTCTPQELAQEDPYRYSGRCNALKSNDVIKLKKDKIPFVIRIKGNDTIDSFVILGENGIPTQNFASACDDMLSGVDYILCDEKHKEEIPKQIYIKNLLGYETKTHYAYIPALTHTLEDSSIKWFFEEGFLPDALLNYLLSLGNKTPKEIFTLPNALEWFDLESLSTTPVEFDLERLRLINKEHLRAMDDKKLSTLFGFADADIGKLAKVYLDEATTINELQTKIEAIFSPKNFDAESGEEMRIIADIITDAPLFSTFDDFEEFLIQKSGLTQEALSQPLRYLLTNTNSGPKLSDIYIYIKSYILEVAS